MCHQTYLLEITINFNLNLVISCAWLRISPMLINFMSWTTTVENVTGSFAEKAIQVSSITDYNQRLRQVCRVMSFGLIAIVMCFSVQEIISKKIVQEYKERLVLCKLVMSFIISHVGNFHFLLQNHASTAYYHD